jgi:hypothetical protein
MKRNLLCILALAGILSTAAAQTANVQIIHNCPTPSADSVDIYLFDGTNWGTTAAISNLKFRKATGYIQLPAVSGLKVAVAPRTASPAITDTLASFAVPALTANQNYVAIAAGEVGGTQPFNIYFSGGAQMSMNPSKIDLKVFHGSPDAPPISMYVAPEGLTPALNNFAFGQFTGGYIPFDPITTVLGFAATADENNLLTGYAADLTGAGGLAAVVFASGYLNGTGSNAFGIFAALPDGTVLELTQVDIYRLQVAHNCADPVAAVVDVFVGAGGQTTQLIDNFEFKTATGTILLPVSPINIIVTDSTGNTASPVATIPFSPMANKNYVAIANGVVDASGNRFENAKMVNGASTIAFNLNVVDNALVKSTVSTDISVYAYHQSPDAPAVDISINDNGTLTDLLANVSYGQEGIQQVSAAADVMIDITLPGQTTLVGVYNAPISLFSGAAVSVVAGGFLTPNDENVTGLQEFGLFVFTPNGGPFIALPSIPVSVNNQSLDIQNIQMFPNPASDNARISFNSLNSGDCLIKVMDLNGRSVKNIPSFMANSGMNTIEIDLTGIASGMYIVQVEINGERADMRLSVAK